MTTATAQKSKQLAPPLKWHGGKHYLADKIIKLMPPRCKCPNRPALDDTGWLHYVEPYFGGGAVLLAQNPEGISEVVNDLNHELMNFWAVLRAPEWFELFQRCNETTPFSNAIYEQSQHDLDSAYESMTSGTVANAWRFFVACRQSLSGRMKGFTGITRNRTRRGMNAEVSAWLSCIEGLPAVHERLKRVLILNKEALDVIRSEDGPRTLFYLDPPYLHETRSTTGEYQHEMTEADHQKLLQTLWNVKGKFLLSGYHSKLYDDCAAGYGWKCHEFDLPNNAASGKTKERKTECVWTNF